MKSIQVDRDGLIVPCKNKLKFGGLMKEIEANKLAWNKLAKEHYAHFKARFSDKSSK